jgi:hypothetical protein
MANPVTGIRSTIQGLLKGRIAAGFGEIPEFKIAPFTSQRGALGQYLIRTSPIISDARKKIVAQSGWDGTRGRFSNVYENVSTALKPINSDAFVLTDFEVEMFNAGEAGVDLFTDGVNQIMADFEAQFAVSVQTAVANLASGGTIDVFSAGTNIALAVNQLSLAIRLATGKQPNVFAVGPTAKFLMQNKNTLIQTWAGSNYGAPGATTGGVTDEALVAYFRRFCNVEFVELGRSIIDASGTTVWQWTTTGYLGYSAPGKECSAVKTLSPRANILDVYSSPMSALEGGPGIATIAKGAYDVITPDTALGNTITLTIA